MGKRMSGGHNGQNARLGVDTVPKHSGCDKQCLRAFALLGKARSRDAGASWIGPEGPQANGATPNLHTRRAYHDPFCRRGLFGDMTCGLTALSPDGRLTLYLYKASRHIQHWTRPERSVSHALCQWASWLGAQTLGRRVCSQWMHAGIICHTQTTEAFPFERALLDSCGQHSQKSPVKVFN